MKKKIKKVSSISVEKVQTSSPETKLEDRRSFLKKLWKGLGAIAAFEIVAVFFGFLFSGKEDNESKPNLIFDAGKVNSFQPNTVTTFRGGRFYLARLGDGGFMALSLRCTHLGCSINWDDDKKRFICPCHSSSFAINGEVENPPAPSALDYFPIKIENGVVKVDIGTKLKRNRFNKSQVEYA
jgi:cytochrome b6-f complex iron-sulfur subunit